MVAKRRTRSTKKAESLKAKSLTPKQAKGVKGGWSGSPTSMGAKGGGEVAAKPY
jgi:hypothetical protein